MSARIRAVVPCLLAAALTTSCGAPPTAGSASAAGIAESPAPDAELADLVFHGGTVWTVDPSMPRADAVAVRGERILAVGSDAEILGLRGPETRVVDLQGRLVLPGFNDTHVHFQSAARFLEFNIMATSSQKDFVERTQAVVASIPDGDWILGGYWGAYDQWSTGSAGGDTREPFTPDLARIAELTAENPMFIQKFDGSEYAANAAALQALGIDPEAPSAPGVEFARGADGAPTGILSGPGAGRLYTSRAIRKFSRPRRIQQTLNALREVARRGVTSLSDMSDDVQLEIYRELHARDELTVRVHFRPGLDRWRALAEEGISVGAGDEWIRMGALKGHIDGIMGTSSARFFEPYTSDAANRGRWRRLMVDASGDFAEGKFLDYMKDADAAGLQLSIHAIGDEANHLLLDYLQELNASNGARDRRFRLVHAQVVHRDDMPRLGELRVVAEVQPFHLSDDMRWMEERIGFERCKGAYAFKSIADSGAVLAFGSDWPGTSASEYPIDPMLGLYAAVTRQTVNGTPVGGWFPDERLSIEAAIEAYTRGGAYSTYEEDIKGAIAAGKLADLAVLSRNILECPPADILTTAVHFTVVGGRIVFERP